MEMPAAAKPNKPTNKPWEKAAAPKAEAKKREVAPANVAFERMFSEREVIIRELEDLQTLGFGGKTKDRIKELEARQDALENKMEEIIDAKMSPKAGARKLRGIDLIEKPSNELMGIEELTEKDIVAEVPAAKLEVARSALWREKIAALDEIDELEKNLFMQVEIRDDQRFGFRGPKTVGSIAEAAIGINTSRIRDLKALLGHIDGRLKQIDALIEA